MLALRMRISKIKLAGFKSFVDPTTLSLPGNLTGVVGPNGCGKSNIIDAMIWVMGESSAKHLRGDSMADVIFNGSNTRKPVGQASVEIVFDNADGALGGQYAGYAEIAIKRTVNRDGVSTYQLNGTRCRRKDVTNVFLGTGLGTRGGYSVIEQGMISRVVEARPEELRSFLEEAAGISKYKERRRETENRIRHTKENIDRLDDIRDEISKQLAHLQRQANAAERYQTLKSEQRRTEAELLALRWRAVDEERLAQSTRIGDLETKVEAAVAELRAVENRQTEKRSEQTRASDHFNRVQSDFYAHSAEISRLEQALQHAKERHETLQQDLREARRSLAEVDETMASDTQALDEMTAQMRHLKPDYESMEGAAERANETLQNAEAEALASQQQWEKFQREQADLAQLEHATRIRLEHIEGDISGANAKLDELLAEHRSVDTGSLEANLNRLRSDVANAEREVDAWLEKRDEARRIAHETRALVAETGDDLHLLRTELETLKGKEASLTALQDEALERGRDDGLNTWLASCGIRADKLLAEQISIETGWERAVEMAIQLPLSAICASGAIDAALGESSFPEALSSVAFVDDAQTDAADEDDGAGHRTRLLDKVTSPWPLASLLAGVYTADSVAEARAACATLKAHESVITRDAYWFGPTWVQIFSARDEKAGILERERQLDTLRSRISELVSENNAKQAAFDEASTALGDHEEREVDYDERLRGTTETSLGLRAQLTHAEATLDRERDRIANLQRDIGVLEEKSRGDASTAATIASTLADFRKQLEEFAARRAELDSKRGDAQRRVDEARTAWREARDRRHEIALRLENLEANRGSLERSASRNKQQRDAMALRCAEIEAALANAVEPQQGLESKLETSLAARLESETNLTNARVALSDLEETIKQQDAERLRLEQDAEQRRERLNAAQLEGRTIEVRLEEIQSRIAQTEYALDTLCAELETDADVPAWEERLARLSRRIDRLGPINLAAIDEYAQLSERKEYLDRQHGDLIQALETLESAIRKIDRETRTRFRETFDQVNAGLKKMFPILFGGGHAYLELTGDDLLETGVTVMARPPGKRNSTIQLLSGGEKALTALAFVFSLFELNPAPFCLLDEVDAPLDDANVARLAQMLQTMSQRIQFVCVTHNKITMEITEQLVGVTMHEAGVSRLVAVNMDEAVEMAAAS